MGAIFIFSLLAFVCLAAIFYPHIGVIGYLGFVLLMPEWNWRWSLPPDFQYQKFIAIATLIGFTLNGFKGNPFRGREFAACACLVGFLGLSYVSAMFTIDAAATKFYMENLWKIVLMSIIAYRLIDTPGKVVACMWVLVLAQGYNAFRINEEYFQSGISYYAHRDWGYDGDNNGYSNLTVPLIAMSWSLLLYSRLWWQKCIAGSILIFQIHQIMLLESRGAMLGCIVLAVLFIYLMPKNTFTIASLVLALAAGGILAGPPVIREFASSFNAEGERDSSAESRFELWKAGARITMDNPLLGVGPYAGQFLVPRYAPEFNTERKGLHNLFFEISTGCGLPATLLYSAFFLIPTGIAFAHRRKRQLADWSSAAFLGAAAGLPAYWVSSMFTSGALQESHYAIAALTLSTNAIVNRMDAEQPDDVDDEYDYELMDYDESQVVEFDVFD